MVKAMSGHFKVGDAVSVPWGLDADLSGTVVEVWGDPPAQVRVKLDLPEEDDGEPVVLLLAVGAVTAA